MNLSPNTVKPQENQPTAPRNDVKHVRYTAVPWSPVVAILYAALIYFVSQFIAGFLLFAVLKAAGWSDSRISDWISQTVTAQFLYVVMAETITFAAIWWFIRLRRSNLRAIGMKRPRWIDPLYTLVGFATYFLVYAGALALVSALVPSINLHQKQELGFDSATSSTISLILTFISLVVLPPIVEETVFRGFMFTGLRTKLKPIAAALLTSVIFAVAHLQFGSGKPLLWVAAIDTFVLSLVLCYLRNKTDSLWSGIFLHALKNGLAFTTLYLIAS
jgi:hypothetical protein